MNYNTKDNILIINKCRKIPFLSTKLLAYVLVWKCKESLSCRSDTLITPSRNSLTAPIDRILSVKNALAWVSMDFT